MKSIVSIPFVGSEEHKVLFSRQFIDTYRAFDPEDLPWPELDEASLARLRSIPFWQPALTAERNAGIMVAGFADSCRDPLVREAMTVQGEEERRHGRLLEVMLKRYDIPVTVPPPIGVETSQHAFVAFGYEECIDAFFGFGIFGLAKTIQLFVKPLFDIFEHVLSEETRHVVLFTNWIAYERARNGRASRAAGALLTAAGYARAVGRLMTAFAPAAARPSDRVPRKQDVGFAAAGVRDVIPSATWRSFLASCVDENARRMADLDPRLLQPRVLPWVAQRLLLAPSFHPDRRRSRMTAPL